VLVVRHQPQSDIAAQAAQSRPRARQVGSRQVPFVHVRPPAQALPQAPQWALSVCVFTHAAPHATVPASVQATGASVPGVCTSRLASTAATSAPPSSRPGVPHDAAKSANAVTTRLQTR
jgi:hypothetical protein